MTAGLLGLIPSAVARAQDPLEPLPPLPAEVAPPHVVPTPPVVQVPPGGVGPSWSPQLLDPVATWKHPPKHVERKARSWKWRRLQGKALGYPEEFHPRPLGASLYDHGRAMVGNGAAARLVLYRYDFIDGSDQLNARGRDQLAKVASQLAVSPYPLLIERTPDRPGLADARRLAVLAALATGPVPVTSDRILVGAPIATGMAGIDAHIIGDNALNRTEKYGPAIPINSNGVNSPSGVTTGAGR
jgi:hypothetical protein